METAEVTQCSVSTMDAAQEARCKEMLADILTLAKKMTADLEATNAAWRAAFPPSIPGDVGMSSSTTPATPPSTTQDVAPTVVPEDLFTDYEDHQQQEDQERQDVFPAVHLTDSDNHEREVDRKLTLVSSASLMSSPTSTPSQEVPLATRITPTEHPLETPARCSTNGLALDTDFMKPLAVSWTSSTTSAPILDGSTATLIAFSDQVLVTHSRCSMPDLYQMVDVRVPTPPFLAISVASTDTMLPQEVVQTIPAMTVEQHVVTPIMCLTWDYVCEMQVQMSTCVQLAYLKTSMTPSSLDINHQQESCISNESYLGPCKLQLACATPCHAATVHTKLCYDAVREADKILQDSDDSRHGRGFRQPKPPWLLYCAVPMHWQGLQQQSAPRFRDHGEGWKYELLLISSLSFRFCQSVMVLMCPLPLSQGTLVQFQLCAPCLIGYAVSKYMLLVGWILAWQILKIQTECDTDAIAPSWTPLQQDQIIASASAAKQLKLYTISEKVQCDHCQLFVEGTLTDEHSIELMHDWRPPWVSLVCIKITGCLASSSKVEILPVECLDSKAELMLEMGKNRKLLQYGVVALFSDLWPSFKCSQYCCVLMKQPWPPPMLVEILESQFENSIIKLQPTPWPSFCSSYCQVTVPFKQQRATVGYVSFDVGLYCSKEKLSWYYYLQFVLEPVLLKGPAVPYGDLDLHHLYHGSVLQLNLGFNSSNSPLKLNTVFGKQRGMGMLHDQVWRPENCRDAHLFHRTCLSELCIQAQQQAELSSSELMVLLVKSTKMQDTIMDPCGFLNNLQAMVLVLVDCYGHMAIHISWISISTYTQLVIHIHVESPKVEIITTFQHGLLIYRTEMETAWGQAEFLGGENVMDPLVDYCLGHLTSMDYAGRGALAHWNLQTDVQEGSQQQPKGVEQPDGEDGGLRLEASCG